MILDNARIRYARPLRLLSMEDVLNAINIKAYDPNDVQGRVFIGVFRYKQQRRERWESHGCQSRQKRRQPFSCIHHGNQSTRVPRSKDTKGCQSIHDCTRISLPDCGKCTCSWIGGESIEALLVVWTCSKSSLVRRSRECNQLLRCGVDTICNDSSCTNSQEDT